MAVTWNPSDKHAYISLSNGNLTANNTQDTWAGVRATLGKSTGKWYFEVTVEVGTTSMIGVASSSADLAVRIGESATGWGAQYNSNKMNNNSSVGYALTFNIDSVIMVAYDLDNGKIWWGQDDVWAAAGDPAAGTNAAYDNLTGTVYPAVNVYGTNPTLTANFGASAFACTVPAGFDSLLTVLADTSETATLTDTIEELQLVDSTAETSTLTDTTDYLHLIDDTAETVTLTDATASNFEYSESAAETVTLTDTNDYLHLVDSVSETATLTDSVSRLTTSYRTNSETGTLTDAIEYLHLVDSTAETATLTDYMVGIVNDESRRRRQKVNWI